MYFWIIAMLVLIVVEVFSVNLTTIWFAIGSLAALITAYITDSVTIQMLVFFIVSFGCLFGTKPFVKKFIKVNNEKTNYDRVIGKKGIVVKDITSTSYGEVKVDGSVWTAKSDDNLKKDDSVTILAIEGVKLVVRKEK